MTLNPGRSLEDWFSWVAECNDYHSIHTSNFNTYCQFWTPLSISGFSWPDLRVVIYEQSHPQQHWRGHILKCVVGSKIAADGRVKLIHNLVVSPTCCWGSTMRSISSHKLTQSQKWTQCSKCTWNTACSLVSEVVWFFSAQCWILIDLSYQGSEGSICPPTNCFTSRTTRNRQNTHYYWSDTSSISGTLWALCPFLWLCQFVWADWSHCRPSTACWRDNKIVDQLYPAISSNLAADHTF